MTIPTIALVSRELTPLTGGGIAPVVRAAGELLAQRGWDVTFVTDGRYRKLFDDKAAAGDPDAETGARWVWVDAPDDHGGFVTWPHLWSARVDAALQSAYPDGAPDVIEFSDYMAEGFVTLQRRATRDPWLARTTVAVRVHTSAEMCAVLNGAVTDDLQDVALFEMERYCLMHADRLIAQGGDIDATYRRFYAELELARPHQVRYALPGITDPWQRANYGELADAARDQVRPHGAPLRLLYLGRTERRKGIVEFAEALASRPDLELELDIVGGDTNSGPLASSVRQHLELIAASDHRIRVHAAVERHAVPTLIGAADATVVPSRWECWPNVAFESLLIGRPVVATPVGGLREIVRDGVNGILANGTGKRDLDAFLDRLVDERDLLRAMPPTAAFAAHLEGLTDVDVIAERYAALRQPEAPEPPATPVAKAAHVAIIVPYFKLDTTLEDTLQSIAEQNHPNLSTLIVNDGSLRVQDGALFSLADRYGAQVITTPNGGLSAARNAGLRFTDAPYVCMLDADDTFDPRFISRCVEALELDPQLAYATTWVRYVDEDLEPHEDPRDNVGYFPFGNWTTLMDRTNLAGVCTSVLRRSALDRHGLRYDERLASYEDWDLYRQLAERGEFGAVFPERWFNYRVRTDSMTRQDAQPHLHRLLAELRAAKRFRDSAWTPGETG